MTASKEDMRAPSPFKVIGENTNLAKYWELYFNQALHMPKISKQNIRLTFLHRASNKRLISCGYNGATCCSCVCVCVLARY